MAKKIKENAQENKQEANLSKGLAKLLKNSLRPEEELTYGEGDEKLTIKIYPQPSIDRVVEATRIAADLFFLMGNSGSSDGFIPGITEFALRYGVLMCFTDFVAPKELHNIYATVMYSPIYDDAADILHGDEYSNYCTICDFRSGVLELVEARKQEIYHSAGINRIVDKIIGFFAETADGLKNMNFSDIMRDSLKNLDLKNFDLTKLGDIFTGAIDDAGAGIS